MHACAFVALCRAPTGGGGGEHGEQPPPENTHGVGIYLVHSTARRPIYGKPASCNYRRHAWPPPQPGHLPPYLFQTRWMQRCHILYRKTHKNTWKHKNHRFNIGNPIYTHSPEAYSVVCCSQWKKSRFKQKSLVFTHLSLCIVYNNSQIWWLYRTMRLPGQILKLSWVDSCDLT